jgi:RimJ/RimL family protein N-acetyltransferase
LVAHGFRLLGVEEKSSGAFIGEMGFADFHRDIAPTFGDRPEVGWALASRCHGKGYATEGLGSILAWGDRHFGKRELVCMISPGNTDSIRLAHKLHFCEAHQTTYKGDEVNVYYRSPP